MVLSFKGMSLFKLRFVHSLNPVTMHAKQAQQAQLIVYWSNHRFAWPDLSASIECLQDGIKQLSVASFASDAMPCFH